MTTRIHQLLLATTSLGLACTLYATEAVAQTPRKALPLFHTTLDFHYMAKQRFHIAGASEDNENTTGALFFTGLFSITPCVELGAGIGVDNNGLPIYLAGRYHPFGRQGWHDLYAYANTGYAPFTIDDTANQGFYVGSGLGYTKMLGRHFGLSLQLGYTMRQVRDVAVYNVVQSPAFPYFEIQYGGERNGIIHALTLGIGLVF